MKVNIPYFAERTSPQHPITTDAVRCSYSLVAGQINPSLSKSLPSVSIIKAAFVYFELSHFISNICIDGLTQSMPDNCQNACLGVRTIVVGIITSIPLSTPSHRHLDYLRANTLSISKGINKIHTHFLFLIPPADRKDKNTILIIQMTALQPVFKNRLPPVIIDPCGQF